MRNSESLYHSLVENSPQNIFRKDLDGRFTFVNHRFCQTLGRKPEEIIGKTDADIFPAELASKYQRDDRRILDTGKTFETIHPATEEVICEVAEGDKEDVDAAVDAARDAFENGPWASMDARDRGALIYKLADMIEDDADELAALETLDNGKPISDSRAADIPLVIDCLRYYGRVILHKIDQFRVD